MSRVALVVIGVVLGSAFGCQKERTAVPDPCPNGECESYCYVCDLEADPNYTVRQHSTDRGTEVEGNVGQCPLDANKVPPLASLDSSSIPEFNAQRSRASNMNRGNARLQDVDIHEHMMGFQARIFECIDLAACYEGGDAIGGGDIDFEFELAPTGKVLAVSVHPSTGLAHPAVSHCARRSLYELRFPSYDGGQMMVTYSMTIEVEDEA
jgi:hypothetical protein